MRTRNILVAVAFAFVWLVLYFRQHLYELGEIVLTYSTFYRLLDSYPDILYHHSEHQLSSPLSSWGPIVVPKIINQIALGNANLSNYGPAIQSCINLHPNWTHNIWTEDNATSFIAKHYPDILPHYSNYAQNIQRANILRYALLHHAGGVYIDLDVTCRVSLDSTPILRVPFVSPGAHPAGVNNAFIASEPGHPFLAQLLDAVPSHDLHWALFMRIPYVENMLSTGCMFFSNQWMIYIHDLLAGFQTRRVYILADEEGNMAPHMLRGKATTPIFVHGGASSWHGWDAEMFLTISNHYMWCLSIFILTTVGAVGVLYLCMTRRNVSFRRICSILSGMQTNKSWSQTRQRKPSMDRDSIA